MMKHKPPWSHCLPTVPPAVGQAFSTLAFGVILCPNHSSLIMSNRSFKEVHIHCSRRIDLGYHRSGLGLCEMDTVSLPSPRWTHRFTEWQKSFFESTETTIYLNAKAPGTQHCRVIKTLACLSWSMRWGVTQSCSETSACMICFT